MRGAGKCQICVVQSQNTSAAIARKPIEMAAPMKSRRAWAVIIGTA